MVVPLLAVRVCVGVVLMAAAASKAGSIREFVPAVHEFGVGRRLAAPVAATVVAAEAALALLLLTGVAVTAATAAAIVLILAFTAAIAVNLRRGRRISCACFGSRDKAPIGTRHLVRNAALLVASGGVLAGTVSFDRPAATGEEVAAALLVAVPVLIASAQVSVAARVRAALSGGGRK